MQPRSPNATDSDVFPNSYSGTCIHAYIHIRSFNYSHLKNVTIPQTFLKMACQYLQADMAGFGYIFDHLLQPEFHLPLLFKRVPKTVSSSLESSELFLRSLFSGYLRSL